MSNTTPRAELVAALAFRAARSAVEGNNSETRRFINEGRGWRIVSEFQRYWEIEAIDAYENGSRQKSARFANDVAKSAGRQMREWDHDIARSAR